MKAPHFASAVFVACIAVTLGSQAVVSREPASAAGVVPVHMLVTVEARHRTEVPEIKLEDVTVRQGKERLQVTDWIPLQGEHAGLELLVLIDDASTPASLGPQLEDLRRFINSQPETTAIGVGYMRNGTVYLAQDFTQDHADAANSLRLPEGFVGAESSPYFSLSDFIKRWPSNPAITRREVLMITDGIDTFYRGGYPDPYVDAAIQDAQCAGVVVFSIYTPGAGHFAHSYWRIYWGQNYLAQLAEETGGESYYFLGPQAPVSFGPYLNDLTHRLTHQYLLTFLAKPEKKPGLQSAKLWTEVPNAELVAAGKVCVPGE